MSVLFVAAILLFQGFVAKANIGIESLVPNWSFEHVDENRSMIGWTANISEIARSDKYAYEGDYSVRFSGQDTEGTLSLQAERISVTAGRDYTLNVYFYAEDEGSRAAVPSVVVDFYDANNKRLDRNQTWSTGSDGVWEMVESKVTAPAGTDSVIVHFYAGAAYDGTLYLDHVMLTQNE